LAVRCFCSDVEWLVGRRKRSRRQREYAEGSEVGFLRIDLEFLRYRMGRSHPFVRHAQFRDCSLRGLPERLSGDFGTLHKQRGGSGDE